MKPNLKSQRGNPSRSSGEDIKIFIEQNSIALEYLLCFIDDVLKFLPPSQYSVTDSNLDKQTIKTRFAAEGLAFATMTLPKLSAGLFLYFETGQVCYPSFAIKKGTVHPVFLSGLFRLACRDGDLQVVAIKLIYQISVMFKKLKGPYPESVLSKQLADFVSVDLELEALDWFSEPNSPILERAREEVRSLFSGFSLDSVHVLPKPGPGATNTPVAKHLRYRPHVLYTQVDKVMPYVDFFFVNAYDLVHETSHYQRLYSTSVLEQRARFKFVHKQVGKARGICIEQNEVQFLQQALKRAMYDWIQKNSMSHGRINFDDQTVNGRLACLASESGLYATIDMSEASDRVARELVSYLFQDTVLHDALIGLSTKWIDLPEYGDQRAIRTAKYAPMGSGLCFPVMSVVHWALIRSMIACSMYPDSYIQDVYVYGDDIIIPSEITEMVYTYLPRFGMKVNSTKSYYRSKFRESCGVHAFNGVDITPVFIKHLPVLPSFKEAMSCLEVESSFSKGGFDSIAALFRAHIRKTWKGYEFPYVGEESPVFGFKRAGVGRPIYPGVVRTKQDSWGNPVQRYRCVVPITDSDVPPTESECYLRHVLTKDVKREVNGNPQEFKLKWKTLPIPGAPYKHHKLWNWFMDIQDPRCLRDIQQEAKYDFTKSGSRADSSGALRFRSIRNPHYTSARSSHLNDSVDPACSWLTGTFVPERQLGSHRVTRFSLCRGCSASVQCGNYPDLR